VRSLQQGWISVAALGLAFTTFLIPALQIALLLWVLLFARVGQPAARLWTDHEAAATERVPGA